MDDIEVFKETCPPGSGGGDSGGEETTQTAARQGGNRHLCYTYRRVFSAEGKITRF